VKIPAMGRLLLLFVLVPAVELMLLVEIGRHIGTLPTLGLIVVTGVVGAALARWQGLAVLRQIQTETAAGNIPAGPLIDGLLILIAGAVLMTPGVLTDIFGFLCLIPAVRTLLKRELRRRFEGAVTSGRVHVSMGGAPGPRGPMRDVTPRRPADAGGKLPEPNGPEQGQG
jgi:UPF0716 protein FxsA